MSSTRGHEPLREAFSRTSSSATPGEDCPPAERIWEAARGELRGEAGRTVLLHALECEICTEAWKLARGVTDDTAAAARAHARRSKVPWLGLAAAAALAGAVLMVDWPGREVSQPTLRQGDGPAVIAAIDPEATLTRDEAVLRWSGPPGATFDVFVMTQELQVLYSRATLREMELRIPADRLEPVAPGEGIVWQVRAVDPHGRQYPPATFVSPVGP